MEGQVQAIRQTEADTANWLPDLFTGSSASESAKFAPLAHNAYLLVQCCFLVTPEIDNEHFRRLAEHTLACGDTVGKLATAAGVKPLALTHHRPRANDQMLEALRADVEADFAGEIIMGEDLAEIEV